ncbi:neocarzinostatin apoprotein domain-containing protein [Kribbella monticola]|uniref:neocarzinostatin apoprotein domain-containing protein n=1 Tax=Kribbella monticola TaxID=2185285 RepID=UPI000DD31A39|nr:neocarzinostatin apoprotein domain-containing protein [Kribbella monticola]
MRILAAVTAATLLLGVIAAPANASTPSIRVSRTTGLEGGDRVWLTARGFAAGSEVRVVQCNYFADTPENDCTNNLVVTAGATGRISTPVTLLDPVFLSHEAGDPTPVYCRADICHLFAVGNDASGNRLILDSGVLTFKGSPATITATPSTDLRASQWVRVRGTAHGAEGRRVRIVEQSCFQIVQASGCYGAGTPVTTQVHSDGTYSAWYRAKRFLADGTDCADPGILGSCVLSVSVLTSAGEVDNSFGYAPIGDMKAYLSFLS